MKQLKLQEQITNLSFFEQLPKVYQEVINKAIKIQVGDEDQEIVAVFKQHLAESLLGCEISEQEKFDDEDIEAFGNEFTWFEVGWEAHKKSLEPETKE